MFSATALFVIFVGWVGLDHSVRGAGINQEYWERPFAKGNSTIPIIFNFKTTASGFQFELDLIDLTLLDERTRIKVHFQYKDDMTSYFVLQWKYDVRPPHASITICKTQKYYVVGKVLSGFLNQVSLNSGKNFADNTKHDDEDPFVWKSMGQVTQNNANKAVFKIDGAGIITVNNQAMHDHNGQPSPFILHRPDSGMLSEDNFYIIKCTIQYTMLSEPITLRVNRRNLYIPPKPTTIAPPTTTASPTTTAKKTTTTEEPEEEEPTTTEQEEKVSSASIAGIIIVLAIIVILVAVITIGAVVLCQFLKAHRNSAKNEAPQAQQPSAQEQGAAANTKQKRPSAATPATATTPATVTDRPQSLPTR